MAVAVAVAAAVAVAVSDMAGEKRISAGSVISCFEVASRKLWGKFTTGPGKLVCATMVEQEIRVIYANY